MMRQKSPIQAKVIILLLCIWGLWTFSISDSLLNVRDTTRTWIPAAVRNYDNYTYDEIGFSIVWDRVPTDDIETLTIYSHHPPLVVWMPAITTKLFGQNMLAIKFGFVAIMLIGTCALYALTKQMHDEDIAFWTLILFAFVPIISFKNITFAHDPLGFGAALLYALFFYRWLKKPDIILFSGLIITTILAVWTAWPAVFFVGVIGIYGLFVGTAKHRIGIIILGIISIVAFIVMMLLYESWWAGSVSSIIEAFLGRTSTENNFRNAPFTLSEWIGRLLIDINWMGSISLFVLSIIGLPYLFNKGTRRQIGFTLALFFSGLLYIIVFRGAAYNHNFYEAFLFPGLSIFAAYAIVYFTEQKPRFTRPIVHGLIITFFLQIAFVLIGSYPTPAREEIESLSDYLEENRTHLSQPAYVVFPIAGLRTNMSLEYYSGVTIEWGVPIEEIPTSTEPYNYILCHENQAYVASAYEQELIGTRINDLCYLYELSEPPPEDE